MQSKNKKWGGARKGAGAKQKQYVLRNGNTVTVSIHKTKNRAIVAVDKNSATLSLENGQTIHITSEEK